MTCPYCGNTRKFSKPIPLCKEMPKELGIEVPLIQQCQVCGATLSPQAFQPGTERYAQAQDRVSARS